MIRLCAAALWFGCAPIALMAQAWIDYDRLMQENAEGVVTTTGADGTVTRTLDMGDGVVVECNPDGCTGMDFGPVGAVGCTFAIIAALHEAILACPALGTPAEQAAIASHYANVGRFVAANAVPPRSWDALQALMAPSAAAQVRDMQGQCVAIAAHGSDHALMVQALAHPDAGIDPATWAPRLPVMNPCL